MLKIKRIKDAVANNKTLIHNFSYLSILQMVNILLPLITYPYLIRVLGKETYGLVVFAQAIVSYLVILVGFGFNISATKEVSIYRDNKEKLSEIVSSVLIIKSLLFVLAFIILDILLAFIPRAHDYKALFLLSMWTCLYDVLFPTWYFQGIEQMKYITYLNLLSRLLFLCLIFVFIHSPADYLLLPVINGIGALIAGLSSLYVVFVKHKISFKIQTYGVLKTYFIDSVPIFISNLSIRLYTSTNKVLVGTFIGMAGVAYFDLAEKLSSLLKTPIQIVGQSLFPKVSKEKNLQFLKKTFYLLILFSLVVLVVAILTSKILITIIGGEQMLPAIPIFRILIISIIPVTISLCFANLTLLPWGYNKDYLKTRLVTLFLYAILLTILLTLKSINLYSLAFIVVLTEFSTAIISFGYCNYRKINFLNKQ